MIKLTAATKETPEKIELQGFETPNRILIHFHFRVNFQRDIYDSHSGVLSQYKLLWTVWSLEGKSW